MPGILKKIIIGNNLLFINNYTRIITELETVVIKKGYCGTGSVISRFITSLCNYSVNFMDFQISEELNYKFMNNYFVSKDEIMNHILFDKTKCPKITLSLKDCFNNSNNE